MKFFFTFAEWKEQLALGRRRIKQLRANPARSSFENKLLARFSVSSFNPRATYPADAP